MTIKEGRMWSCAVQLPSEHGVLRKDFLVLAPTFDAAVALVKQAWPKAPITHLSPAFYEALVSADR